MKQMQASEYIIFTDMDGTLVDHDTYSYDAAIPALELIKAKNIPLIFCTSKTRAELEVYCHKLDIRHPFISENGGAVFIPDDYFDFPYDHTKQIDGYNVIELGVEYDILERTLKEICTNIDCQVIGLGDMDVDEVCQDTGLDRESAALAKQRDYDEAFRIKSPAPKDELLEKEIIKRGFNYTKGGRYYHIMGNNDKGKVVHILTDLYRKKWPGVKTIGLGDSLNDLSMLMAVDIGTNDYFKTALDCAVYKRCRFCIYLAAGQHAAITTYTPVGLATFILAYNFYHPLLLSC